MQKTESRRLILDETTIDKLTEERDTINKDLDAINNDLKSLTGKEFSLDEKVEKIINDNGKTSKLKRAYSTSTTSRSRSNSPSAERDEVADKRGQSARMPSLLILPDRLNDTANQEKRKAILESQRNNKQVFNRNKRMFGMLMGTLKQFKTEETGRERTTTKRNKVEEKLELALEEEVADVNKKVGMILEQKQTKQDLLDKADLKLDIMSRYKALDTTYRNLCYYIQTETKPKIFWIPKEHTAITEQKLKETKDYYGLYVAEKTAKYKKDLTDLEESAPQPTTTILTSGSSETET